MSVLSTAQQLYTVYFLRPADSGGYSNFVAALTELLPQNGNNRNFVELKNAYFNSFSEGATAQQIQIRGIVNNFSSSAESAALYGNITADPTEFVTAVYKNAFNRSPDQEGLDYWVGQIKIGLAPAGAALAIVAAAFERPDALADQAAVNNIATAANIFTQVLQNNSTLASAYSGNEAASVGRGYLKKIDSQTNINDQAELVSLVNKSAEKLVVINPPDGLKGGNDDVSVRFLEQAFSPLTQSEMSNAGVLTFQDSAADSPFSRSAFFATTEQGALLRDVFRVDLKAGEFYTINSTSFFDPFVTRMFDNNGNPIFSNSENNDFDGVRLSDGGTYDSDTLSNFQAPYTGSYYIKASWDQGSFYDYVSLFVFQSREQPVLYRPLETLHVADPSTLNANQLPGTRGDDVLNGTPNADYIAAGSGDDLIQAGSGNDLIVSGAGNDTIFTGVGEDKIFFMGSNDPSSDLGNGRFNELDVIRDFDVTKDSLVFSRGFFLGFSYGEDLSVSQNIEAVLNKADAFFNSKAGPGVYFGVVAGSEGATGIVIFDDAADGYDTVVQLIGVTDFASKNIDLSV